MADYSTWIPEEYGSKTESYGEGYSRNVGGVTYYKDPSTGNIYDVPFAPRGYWDNPDQPQQLDFANAKLVTSGQAASDPFIQALGYQNEPIKAQELYQQKLDDPQAFYGQIAKELENDIFGNWSNSWEYEGLKNVKQQFDELKNVAPDIYYENLLANKAKQIGWSYGSGNPEYAKPNEEELRSQIPEAIKAGLTEQQISNLINKNINESAQLQQTLASNAASGGNFWNQNLMGALKISAFALGAGGLDAALGASAAGTPNAYMASAGLNPGVFEGAAFTMPSSLGSGSYLASELAGPTYQELGYTGLEAGQMGPTYGEMGYTGLNNAEAIAAADAASKGLTGAEALKYINQARQVLGVGSSIAKLLGGGASGSGGTSGINANQLASALRPNNTFNPINLQQIQPKNPFFGSTQGTLGGEDIYDVSGSNLANALRKR